MADYSDLDRQIEQLKRCEIIAEGEVKALCAKAREILVEEGNVQRVDSPVTVCWLLRKAASFNGPLRSRILPIFFFIRLVANRCAAIFTANFMISRNCSK